MLKESCAPALPDWLSFLQITTPVLGRILAGLVLLTVLVLFIRLRPNTSLGLHSSKHELSKDHVAACLAPAIWTVVVFGALLIAFMAGNFFGDFSPSQIEFIGQSKSPNDSPLEIAAQGVWSATFCAIILGCLASCWMFAGIWHACSSKTRRHVLFGCLGMAILVVVSVVCLGLNNYLPAFGSKASAYLLCGTWNRTGLARLGPITDGLNAIAIGVAGIVAAGFCLVTHAIKVVHDRATRGITDSDDRANIIQDAKSTERLMDYLLYVGAAALIAGLLEVVATLTWAYAPFPGSADLKVQTDLCKALQPVQPLASVNSAGICCRRPKTEPLFALMPT